MMRLLLGLCLLIALSFAQVGPWSTQYTFDSRYKFQWALSDDQTEVFWRLETTSISGWIGIGISPTGAMAQSDVVMSYVQSGNVIVSDRYVTVDHDVPSASETQDVFLYSFNTTSTSTVIILRRKLNTGDSRDIVLPWNSNVHMVWSYNRLSTDTSAQHTTQGTTLVAYGNVTDNTTIPRNLTVTSTMHARVAVDGLHYIVEWLIEIPVKITINVSVACRGWVGFGFSPNANMRDADVTVMRITEDGSGDITDGYSDDFKWPPNDLVLGGKTDYQLLNFSSDGTYSNFTFWRYLDTYDQYDHPIEDKFMKIIWAYSNNKDVQEQHDYQGGYEINFYTGAAQPLRVDPLLTAHGVLMALAWIIMTVFAIMIARYGKNALGIWWFYWHGFILILVAVMVTVAFAFAVSATTTGHFKSGHRAFGLVIFILMYIQIALGVLADRMYDKQRTEIPIFPDKVHWWSGRILLLLAIANVYYGMSEIGTTMAFYILISAVLFAAFVFMLIKEFTTKDGSAHFIVHAIVKRPSRRKKFVMSNQ